jgi:transposase
MKGLVSVPMGYCSLSIYRLKRGVSLSEEAEHRLKVIKFYEESSRKFSKGGKRSASITARHFGHCLSYVYKWLKRYDRYDLASLESKSRKPKKSKKSSIPCDYIEKVRRMREDFPRYSGKKIYAVLKKTQGEVRYSPSTINRIIRRHDFYFALKKKKVKRKPSFRGRTFKERGFKARGPREVIEFDMKEIFKLGRKLYAFSAIDPFTKDPLVKISSSCSSKAALSAAKKAIGKYGKGVYFLNDNGSENLGEVMEYLKKEGVKQIFAYPNTPKDKPHIERFIGSFQREFLDEYLGGNERKGTSRRSRRVRKRVYLL